MQVCGWHTEHWYYAPRSVLHNVAYKGPARTLLLAVALLPQSPCLWQHVRMQLDGSGTHDDAAIGMCCGRAGNMKQPIPTAHNALAIIIMLATAPRASFPQPHESLWMSVIAHALHHPPPLCLALALIHAALFVHAAISVHPPPLDTLLHCRLLLALTAPRIPPRETQLLHHAALLHARLDAQQGPPGTGCAVAPDTAVLERLLNGQECTASRCAVVRAALRVGVHVPIDLVERVVADAARHDAPAMATAHCCALVSSWFDHLEGACLDGAPDAPSDDDVLSDDDVCSAAERMVTVCLGTCCHTACAWLQAWLLPLLTWRAGYTAAALRAAALWTLGRMCTRWHWTFAIYICTRRPLATGWISLECRHWRLQCRR